MCVCVCVLTERLYNVDEAVLATMEEKYKILSDEVERLEKENQTVRRLLNWHFHMCTDYIIIFNSWYFRPHLLYTMIAINSN